MSEFTCSGCSAGFSKRGQAIENAVVAVCNYSKDRQRAYWEKFPGLSSGERRGLPDIDAEPDFETRGLRISCYIRYGFFGRTEALGSMVVMGRDKIDDILAAGESLSEYAVGIAKKLADQYYGMGPFSLARMGGCTPGYPQVIPEGAALPIVSPEDL